MRIIKTGTAAAPYALRRADLPSDGSLAHSFFKHVNFGRLGLAAFDLRDMDVLDCDLTRVRSLPGPDQLGYIYSRNSEWPEAAGVLPDDIPSANHDMYGAWMRRKAATLTGRPQLFAQRLAETATGSYLQSWHNNYNTLKVEFNFTDREGYDYALQHVYADSPRLAARLLEHLQTGNISTRQIGPMDLTSVRIKSADGLNTVDVARGDQLAGYEDRYLLARHLEDLHPGIRFWVAWIDPIPFVFAIHERAAQDREEEWWFTATAWPE